MEVFVDIVTRTGEYLPAKNPVWIEAGVGKVVPFACRFAARSGVAMCKEMAVYHVEESRFLAWPGFSETCVRNFDTIVVIGNRDPSFEEGKSIEGYWLVTEGIERRAFFEAEHRLRAFENRRLSSAPCRSSIRPRPVSERAKTSRRCFGASSGTTRTARR